MDGAALEIWALEGIRRVELGGGRVSVGKGAANDIVLDDGTVSRLHASLEEFDEGWCVNDLGSSNGTFLRIRGEQLIPPGTHILMGQQLFRVDFG